jgi:hypothetical protein
MCATLGIDELGVDPDLVAVALNAALQHIVDTEILPHLAHVDGLALVDHGRIAGDEGEDEGEEGANG